MANDWFYSMCLKALRFSLIIEINFMPIKDYVKNCVSSILLMVKDQVKVTHLSDQLGIEPRTIRLFQN